MADDANAAAPPTVDLTSDDPVAGQPEDSEQGLAELEQQLADVDEELQDVEESLQALQSRQASLRRRREDLQRQIATERRVGPRADWGQAAFAWDAQLRQALSSTFGLSSFRPLQREVMNATLSGRDVLVLMPSGGGKSLCYQLPALISGGVTLVVSPLLSLIVDQVMGLQGLVQAYSLTSLSTKEETAAVMNTLTAAASKPKAGKGGSAAAAAAAAAGDPAAQQPMLLYCTPEKIVASKRLMSKLEKLYQAGKLVRIAIDEAHCASTWGNDFRPDYKKLGVLKQQFPDTPIIALTATATTQVCKDVTNILGIAGVEQFSASINRPNLRYEVQHKAAADEFDHLQAWICDNYPDASAQGIVYCLSRKDCEVLAEKLNNAGITAAYYHADMEPGTRAASHSAWSEGHVKVMVATIAFGMGINKPNVRFVAHTCLSKSLENLYQESGRAGRDLQPARCVLFYRLSDVLRQASVVCMDHGWQRHLMSVMRYAASTQGCRRAMLAAHFAEPPPQCNGTCDLCAAAAAAAEGQSAQQQQEDLTEQALKVVQLLQERKGEKRATLNQILDDLQRALKKAAGGADSSRLLKREEQEWLVQEMLLQGLLTFEFGFTAYATNTYLVAAPLASMLGRHRLVCVRPAWLLQLQPAPAPAVSKKRRNGSQPQRPRPSSTSKPPVSPIVVDNGLGSEEDDFI